LYDSDQQTTFLADLTNRQLRQQLDPQATIYSVLKSMVTLHGVDYFAERINYNGHNGILTYTSPVTTPSTTSITSPTSLPTPPTLRDHHLYGFNLDAEDPRMIVYRDKIYLIFNIRDPQNCGRIMCISSYDDFHPIRLHVAQMIPNPIEKNWTPLVKNDQLYFIYTYDPLVVLHYDFNPAGLCDLVWKPVDLRMPFNTTPTYLRGGSCLVPYQGNGLETNRYYVGLCHSRVGIDKKNIGGYDYFYYQPFVVLLDTQPWQVVQISKPLMLSLPPSVNVVKTVPTTKIIFEESPWMCAITPNSLNHLADNQYTMTVNVNEIVTLEFQLTINLIPKPAPVSWNQVAKSRSVELISRVAPEKHNFY
jgi:hypothetical protein